MASRSVSLVKGWLNKNCPTLPAITEGRAQFIVHQNAGSNRPSERMFLRSTYDGWGTVPFYEQMMLASTDVGAERLLELSGGRPESLLKTGDSLVAGSVDKFASLRTNEAISYKSMADRLREMNAEYNLGPWYDRGVTGGWTLQQYQSSSMFIDARLVFEMAGMTAGPVESIIHATAAAPIDELVAKHGPGRVFLVYLQRIESGNNKTVYIHAERSDDSLNVMEMSQSYWWTPTLANWEGSNGPRKFNVTITDTGEGYPTWMQEIINLQNALGTSRSIIADGADDYTGVDTLNAIDHYWLPLMSVPRDQTYMVSSNAADVQIIMEVESEYDVITVKHLVSTTIGSVPVRWYMQYAEKEIERGAANAERLRESIISLEPNIDSVVTYAEQPQSVNLPKDMIKLTTIYRDYANAKEKACEDNDFMSKEFVDGMTYGSLQTLLNGSRMTPVLYGFRSLDQLQPLSEDTSPSSGSTLALGGETVAITDENGTSTGTFDSSQVTEFVTMIAQGASVTGGSVEDQLALWGYSPIDFESRISGLSEQTKRIDMSESYGTRNAVYDFRWGSLGVSGYPLYAEVDAQTGYRMVMVSKGLLNKIGPELRRIHTEHILQSDAIKLYPTLVS